MAHQRGTGVEDGVRQSKRRRRRHEGEILIIVDMIMCTLARESSNLKFMPNLRERLRSPTLFMNDPFVLRQRTR